jgi:hypothetical protein
MTAPSPRGETSEKKHLPAGPFHICTTATNMMVTSTLLSNADRYAKPPRKEFVDDASGLV